MSHIPNSAMPHARASDEAETADRSFLGSVDWADLGRSALNEARELRRRGMDYGQRGIELIKQRPRDAAAAGAVVDVDRVWRDHHALRTD